jgi:hypothetical protein
LDDDLDEDKALIQIIMQVLEDMKPENVEQLIKIAEEKTSLPEHKAIEHVIQLQTQGKIVLREPSKPLPQKTSLYLKSKEAYWYWATVILAIATMLAVFTIPEGTYPFVHTRHVLGALFVTWFPGYSFTRALFPKSSKRNGPKSLSTAERCALGVGLSLVIAGIVGMLLNYSPWGIRLAPISLCLFIITAIFATAATIREYRINKENPWQMNSPK